jgi:hypothetical protein
MKNLLTIILIVLFITSCDRNPSIKDKKYTLTYVVFYPNYTDTITTVVSKNDLVVGSDKGTNYIWNRGYIYQGTSPVKILRNN